MNYKLIKNLMTNQISAIKLSLDNGTNLSIPIDFENRHYQQYLKWCDGYELIDNEWVKTSEGNEPEPADEV